MFESHQNASATISGIHFNVRLAETIHKKGLAFRGLDRRGWGQRSLDTPEAETLALLKARRWPLTSVFDDASIDRTA